MVSKNRDLLKALDKEALDPLLQAEMTEFMGAAPGELTSWEARHPTLTDSYQQEFDRLLKQGYCGRMKNLIDRLHIKKRTFTGESPC